MRPHFLTPALLLLAACSDTLPPRPPPSDSFAYPSALVHRPAAGGPGTLYVASSNFDKLYDYGAVLAVNLNSVAAGGVLNEPLPTFGEPPRTPVPEIGLNVPPGSQVYVRSITGDMALYQPEAGGAPYLFVPSRSEDDLLQVVQASGAELRCVGTDSNKCFERAFSLTEAFNSPDGQPGAPAPFGIAVGQRPNLPADLWVTHVASSLKREGDDREQTASTYVVRTGAQAIVDGLSDPRRSSPLQLPASDFVRLTTFGDQSGLAGGHAVALGPDFAFLSGRVVTSGQGGGGVPPFLLRALSRDNPSLALDPNLRAAYPDIEARGLALNEGGTRLYMAGRAAGSTLLVMNVVSSPTSLGVSIVRAIDTLPPGASALKVLSRGPNRGDLVVITCSAAGVLAIYDDEVGDIVAQVPDLGEQPYALAVEPQSRPSGPPEAPVTTLGARVYAANFGDGQVSVVDIPNLDNPQTARLVARLGGVQRCAPGDTDEACPENSL